MKSRPNDEAMAEIYRDDPDLALHVINSILEDGDQAELLIVLRQMTKAFGGVPTVTEKANLNPTQLYRTLSPSGNPALRNFSAILIIIKLSSLIVVIVVVVIIIIVISVISIVIIISIFSIVIIIVISI